MSEWQVSLLGDIADVQTGPFGSQLKNEQYIDGGLPVITVEHIKNFKIANITYPSVTNEDAERLQKYSLKAGDIIFSRVGSVDLSAFVKPENQGWLFSSRMLRVRPNDDVYARFLSYFFQQESFREYIINISVGATMPSINTKILQGVEVKYPPLPEQKAIADVLSALDDKIDLLQRQNETLEKMAETLFRQWFIEEAKEDWELCSFEKWVSGTKGGDWGKEVPVDDFTKAVYCLRGTDIASLQKNMSVNAPLRFIKEKKFFSIEPDNGDIVIEISGGTETQSTGRSYYINEGVRKLFTQPIIFSNFCRLITVRNSEYSYFIYLYLKFLYDTDEFFALENGSSGIKNLNYKAVLFEQKFLMPAVEKVLDFHELVCSHFIKIDENRIQIQTLQNLRDTLLPKLMSGEVRVKLD